MATKGLITDGLHARKNEYYLITRAELEYYGTYNQLAQIFMSISFLFFGSLLSTIVTSITVSINSEAERKVLIILIVIFLLLAIVFLTFGLIFNRKNNRIEDSLKNESNIVVEDSSKSLTDTGKNSISNIDLNEYERKILMELIGESKYSDNSVAVYPFESNIRRLEISKFASAKAIAGLISKGLIQTGERKGFDELKERETEYPVYLVQTKGFETAQKMDI